MAMLMITGCGPKTDSTATRETKSAPSPAIKKPALKMPDIPDDEKVDVALENPLKAFKRSTEDFYEQDTKIPSGHIRGLCHFEGNAKITLPARPGRDITKEDRIKNPLPREVEFLKQFVNRKPVGKRSYGPSVSHVVIRARKISKGPLAVPNRLRYMIWNSGYTRGPRGVAVVLCPDKILMQNTDPFTYDMVVTHVDSGKVVWEQSLPAYTRTAKGMIGTLTPWNKHKEPGGSSQLTGFLRRSKLFLSPLISELGMYRVTCKRHPWVRYHFWVVQNPYLIASDRSGKFSLKSLPAGKHTIDVWHPNYEPVKKSFEIEIEKGKTQEIKLAFKVPAPGK